jgi:type II secretory ATPase GspE/PulE/Tfp pilus assembly ATPase PilB-like protein
LTTLANAQELLSQDSAIELVNGLLRRAHELAASDLHLIPTGEGLEVLFRRDGELSRLGVIRNDSASTVIGARRCD